MVGRQVKLFLADGAPGGLTVAELSNWTGKIVAAPRSKLAELIARPEAAKPGVYLLIGDDAEAVGGTRLYVGESDALDKRLKSHNLRKDFWDQAVSVSSTDDNLTKAHVSYLEASLIKAARRVGRAAVENNTDPSGLQLPEDDVAVMDEFLSNIHLVLPVLGIDLLRGRAAPSAFAGSKQQLASPTFRLLVSRAGIDAAAQEIDGEFTVLAGSTVASSMRANTTYASATAASYATYEVLHKRLRDEKAIDTSTVPAKLVRDVVFKSPSTAGAIVSGRSCNGRQAWSTDDGTTYGAWQERGV